MTLACQPLRSVIRAGATGQQFLSICCPGHIFAPFCRAMVPEPRLLKAKWRAFPLRFFLTIIAVALVALLTAALVAPLFIDWSAHRAEIEARLGAATGARIALSGPITLRFLPVPYLDVGAGSATAPGPDAPKLSFEKARLELALAKLASGEIRFSEIRLEKPVLTLVRAPDGSLPLTPPREADAVGFDALVAHGGTIRIMGAGGPARTIEGMDLDGDAPSLAGPYRISGRFSGPGGAPVAFRLTTEKAEPLTIPVRASVDS